MKKEAYTNLNGRTSYQRLHGISSYIYFGVMLNSYGKSIRYHLIVILTTQREMTDLEMIF